MENNEELQSLINDLRSKLGDNASVEIDEFDEGDEQPEINTEPQSDPGPALPDEVLSMIARVAEAAAREVFGGNVRATIGPVISAMDDSAESRETMRSMLRGFMGVPLQAQCYHYILDAQGNPVHTEDDDKIEAFQRRKGHILASKRFHCFGLAMQVTTDFMVHNEMIGNEPPLPRWSTQLIREDTEEMSVQEITYSAADAMYMHRFICAKTRRFIAEAYRKRWPSPTRRKVALRRAAADQDVLRRRGVQ